MSGSPPPLLAVGRVARAHGVRGRILVAPYNPESAGLEEATVLWLSPKGRPEPLRQYQVDSAERANLGYLVALRGVNDRNAADALRGHEVHASRSELPELDEGEVWAADLIGLTAVDAAGAVQGEVTALEQAGPNELLVLRRPDGTEALVPLALALEADVDGRRLLIEVPLGLFEAQQKGPATTAAEELPEEEEAE